MVEVTGFGVKQFQGGGPVQQGDIDSPSVGGIVMHILVIQFMERRFLQELPQDEGVFHLRESDDVRKAAGFRFCPENGLRKGVCLGLKAFPRPVPFAPGGKLRIRYRCGIVPPVKKVLYIPE